MSLSSCVILFAAVFFLLYGLAFSIDPAAMAMLVTGVAPQGESALVDFRATYGGMTMAVGAILYYLNSIKQFRPALVFVIFVLGGMAITRSIGMAVEGPGNLFMTLFLVLEMLGCLLALLAIKSLSKRSLR